MRTSRTESARPVPGRRLRWPVVAALLLISVAFGACSDSKFRYVSNASLNTYLKVPKDWKVYSHDDLVSAELDAARRQNESLIDVLVNQNLQWRMAFDGDPRPSIEHIVSHVEEPVVEVIVRALDQEEHEQVSLAALRNVVVRNYDELKQQAAGGLAGIGLGAGEASLRPLDEEELHYEDGVRGVRLRYLYRPTPSSPFYAFDQTTLVDAKAERLYLLLIRSGEAQFLRHNQLFTEIAKSFTVKPKG